jgi:NDP-sugar pyrophosphorylase family protein
VTQSDAAPQARAMILAAGLGTRLRPLTERTPKPLVEIAGHPLVAYGLGLLRAHGIHDVVVNLHHLSDQVVTALGDGSRYGVRIHYSREEALLDTGGGIRHAAPLLDEIGGRSGGPGGPIVIANSDVISEIPVSDVVRLHRRRGALVTLVLREDPRAASYGLFEADEEGRIRRFLAEGEPDPRRRPLMFASLQVIERSLIDRMPRDRAFGTMSELYPALFRAGERFFAYEYRGLWLTADTPQDVAETDATLRRIGLPRYMRDLPLGKTRPVAR